MQEVNRMRVLFCNIAWMDFYKGITDKDTPKGGGSFVDEMQNGNEIYNFLGEHISFDDGFLPEDNYCLGFVETKTTNGEKRNQLHIEKIDGCEACIKEESVEDVLVIYCATHPSHGFTTVVGWYQNATVFRHYQNIELTQDDGSVYEQACNAIAKKENCVLLPRSERSQILKWKVPRKKNGISYGFGRANVWFASEQQENDNLAKYLKELTDRINEYSGENWIDRME